MKNIKVVALSIIAMLFSFGDASAHQKDNITVLHSAQVKAEKKEDYKLSNAEYKASVSTPRSSGGVGYLNVGAFLSMIVTFFSALFAPRKLTRLALGLLFIAGLVGMYFFPGTGVEMLATAPALLSVNEIERAASRLSSFEGPRRGAMLGYTGANDDLLSFEGDLTSFAQELDTKLEKQFTVSIVNANAATRIAVLQAGYLLGNATLAPGQLVEGAFNDKNAAVGLTGATQEPKSIQELQLFLNYVPTRLLAMKIQSTVANQLNSNLTYSRLNPFKDEENSTVRPKNFVNQNSNQNDQVMFYVNKQLDFLSKLEYPLVGVSTTYITYFFGASLNISEGLMNKAARAASTIRAIQPQQFQGKALVKV